jgi:flagellar secretion chaperone FliS
MDESKKKRKRGRVTMVLNNPFQMYQKQAVTTAKPEALTLMLFEGMVKFIRLSKFALKSGNIGEGHHNNLKAQDILLELMATLKDGYVISEPLHQIYDYMRNQLIQANIKKNIEILEEVEGLAVELVDTWSEAIKLTKIGSKYQ